MTDLEGQQTITTLQLGALLLSFTMGQRILALE